MPHLSPQGLRLRRSWLDEERFPPLEDSEGTTAVHCGACTAFPVGCASPDPRGPEGALVLVLPTSWARPPWTHAGVAASPEHRTSLGLPAWPSPRGKRLRDAALLGTRVPKRGRDRWLPCPPVPTSPGELQPPGRASPCSWQSGPALVRGSKARWGHTWHLGHRPWPASLGLGRSGPHHARSPMFSRLVARVGVDCSGNHRLIL